MKIFIFLLISSFSVISWAKVCGRIDNLRGQIEVLKVKDGEDPSSADHARTGTLATKKMKLSCSDIVVSRKGARAKIRLVNRAILTMGPNSRIEIQNYIKQKTDDPDQLKLTYGKVRALFGDKKKKDNKSKESQETSRWLIKTPSAVAGVRGTDFYISHNPNNDLTEQATLEGAVEVQQTQTGEKVLVKPGQQVVVEDIKKAKKAAKPLEVKDIQPELKEVIRQTSAIARNDKRFASKEAVKILGNPKTWTLPPDELPLDLKELKEEF